MREIVVWGACPVAIHVDTETNEVTRVVVIDEELRYPKDIDTPVMEGDLAVSDAIYAPAWPDLGHTSKEIVAARKKATKALAIAIGPAEDGWPVWEFGY